MRVPLFAAADYAGLTADHKLNVMGIFTEINPPALPFDFPLLYVAVVFEASPRDAGTEKSVNLVLNDAGGASLFALDATMSVPATQNADCPIRITKVLALTGIRFENPGIHRFMITIGGETAAEIRLRVNHPRDQGGSDGNARA